MRSREMWLAAAVVAGIALIVIGVTATRSSSDREEGSRVVPPREREREPAAQVRASIPETAGIDARRSDHATDVALRYDTGDTPQYARLVCDAAGRPDTRTSGFWVGDAKNGETACGAVRENILSVIRSCRAQQKPGIAIAGKISGVPVRSYVSIARCQRTAAGAELVEALVGLPAPPSRTRRQEEKDAAFVFRAKIDALEHRLACNKDGKPLRGLSSLQYVGKLGDQACGAVKEITDLLLAPTPNCSGQSPDFDELPEGLERRRIVLKGRIGDQSYSRTIVTGCERRAADYNRLSVLFRLVDTESAAPPQIVLFREDAEDREPILGGKPCARLPRTVAAGTLCLIATDKDQRPGPPMLLTTPVSPAEREQLVAGRIPDRAMPYTQTASP